MQPVKRVTEYPILLEKLLEHTPAVCDADDDADQCEHPDRHNLEEALVIAKRLCDQVNLLIGTNWWWGLLLLKFNAVKWTCILQGT